MTRALGLSAFVLALLSPFISELHLITALCLLTLAVCFYVGSVFLNVEKHRPRPLDGEVDEAQLQHELEGLIRQINAEDGK